MRKTKTRKRTTEQKSRNKKGGVAVMMIGATGAVVGAALGTAAAIALANEKTRKVLTQKVGQFAQDAATVADSVGETAETNYSAIKKKIPLKRMK